jgi:acyl-CoA synthetase (NDP forming)
VAVAAAATIGYPVVLKDVGLLHKSDAGGVAVGLAGEAELLAALGSMRRRTGATSFAVEAMADVRDGVELLIGCRTDARFGPVLLVGLGGLHTEVLRDVRMALAPAAAEVAATLLGELRGAPVLRGMRGRPPVAVSAAARVAAALSTVAAEHPWIAEIEINPLLVTPAGALALDARIVPA